MTDTTNNPLTEEEKEELMKAFQIVLEHPLYAAEFKKHVNWFMITGSKNLPIFTHTLKQVLEALNNPPT